MLITKCKHRGAGYRIVFGIAITQLMRNPLLQPIFSCEVAHEEVVAGFIDRASLIGAFHAGIPSASKDAFVNTISNAESTRWKRMRSGDRPGLQNRRVASSGVTGGFDPHSLPPISSISHGGLRGGATSLRYAGTL